MALLLLLWLTTTDGPQKTVVRLRVNQVEAGDAVVLVSSSDVLVQVADLREAGLSEFTGDRKVIGEREYVSLFSLAPAVTYTLNGADLVLDIAARADVLGRKTVDLGSSRPSDIEYTRNASAFVNYAVTRRSHEGLDLFGETGVSVAGALLSASVSRAAGRLRRGPAALTIDDRARMRRWIVGETPPQSVAGVGGLPLLGIGVSRDFDLDPYFIRFPGLNLSTPVETPSTLEVYVNDRLVQEMRLAPGQLDIQNLPIVHGSGSVRLLLRDAFGREREVSSRYYVGNRNLARGTSEYSYNVGLIEPASESPVRSYGPISVFASHRTGVTDRLTVGFHTHARPGLVNIGPTAAVRLARGEVELSSAASSVRGARGGAAWGTYRYQGHSFGVGGIARVRSMHSPAFDVQQGTPPFWDASVFANRSLGVRGTASFEYRLSQPQQKPKMHTVAILGSMRITSRASGVVSATTTTGAEGRRNVSVSVGLSYFTGNRSLASATATFDGGVAGTGLQWDRSLPAVGRGVGYTIAEQTGTTDRWGARLRYQGAYGRYELGQTTVDGIGSGSFAASGGVVAIGGRVYATQPVQQGFGLLRLRGLPGVRAYFENQEVGRTNASGDLVLPTLLPYYGNRIRIAADELPVNTHIGATEKLVAPSYRGGAIILFPIARIQAITGRVVAVDADGRGLPPSSGDLIVTAANTPVISPLGTDGEFYFENLPPGRYPARVEGSERDCTFVLTIPASDDPFLKLGRIACNLGALK